MKVTKKYLERQKREAERRLKAALKDYADYVANLDVEHAKELLQLNYRDLEFLILGYEKAKAICEAINMMEDEEDA